MTRGTAITRTAPPVPLRWLFEQGLLRGRHRLDYGCGRQIWYGMAGHDPHWKPHLGLRDEGYDTIACVYVLNTVDEETQELILRILNHLLKPGGHAYIAVRRDLPREGRQGRGCWQRYVELDLPLVREVRSYCIYDLEKPGP